MTMRMVIVVRRVSLQLSYTVPHNLNHNCLASLVMKIRKLIRILGIHKT